MKAVPLAAIAATAAIVLSLRAQDSADPAPPPAPPAPPAKPYLVIDAQPSSPANAGNGPSRLADLEAQLNQAATAGYRLAAAHQYWIIMEHSSLAQGPVSSVRRRVVLPVDN